MVTRSWVGDRGAGFSGFDDFCNANIAREIATPMPGVFPDYPAPVVRNTDTCHRAIRIAVAFPPALLIRVLLHPATETKASCTSIPSCYPAGTRRCI
jgi:hypothetical protein